MGYQLREHTADVAVEAAGPTLGAAFAAAADGMAAAMCDEVPEDGERFDVAVRAESREALLFDYLDELMYQRDVRGVLPVDNEVTVRRDESGGNDDEWDESRGNGDEWDESRGNGDEWDESRGNGDEWDESGHRNGEWTLAGSARGVPLAGLGARDLKAVTYSEMDLRETGGGWRAYVVFDV